jgi:hypothetical protein
MLAVLALAALFFLLHRGRQSREKSAREQFPQQREQLQQLFFERAAASGKPKGLRWKECQWEEWTEFVRHRKTGELAALVSLTIHFEAIAGGDMEGLPAVGLPRNASAVFFFHHGRWDTLGKVLFNKNPDEAADHFRDQYLRLGTLSGPDHLKT